MAQFCTLVWTVIDENGTETEEVLDKQVDIVEEVYFKMLYKHWDFGHTEEEISERIGQEIKKISEHEK